MNPKDGGKIVPAEPGALPPPLDADRDVGDGHSADGDTISPESQASASSGGENISLLTADTTGGMTGPRGKRERDPLPKEKLTPEWKQRVRDELKAQGRSHAWLAEQVGAKRPSSITKMLADEANTSEWVLPTCEVLKIDPPQDKALDPVTKMLVEVFLELTPEAKLELLGKAQEMKRRQ